MTISEPSASHFPGHLHPAYAHGIRSMEVAALSYPTDDVLRITLRAAHGGALAPYQPGSHIIITAGDVRNAYSLIGADLNPHRYEISVLRTPDGNGSSWLHAHSKIGTLLEVEGPRCLFPPVTNQRHALLVAGGIGVTPVLSHARAIARSGGSADIIYSYRAGHAAHLDDLRALADRTNIDLIETTTVAETVTALSACFARQPLGTHAYACGPPAMLETYEQIAESAGWPSARVHSERFTAPDLDPGEPFTVQLASTGRIIEVPAGVSLLERLLDSGVKVNNLCRQGVCGECRIPVLSGTLHHRDYVLTDAERESAQSMMCCVSRGTDIEVDL
ncbi:PDR/VanB family oxidoreductase [Rhodococcus globerulus]|uniref:PDR/VanB family oxidoreductase n=1 Tax=Rhodococcus globerulus TaxID=33008 RepID=A0ABU4C420_RHOGO|nr:PDR/VanB family oxidoreductase [Rhodococcus globerulus]MDV6271236.1 PDR/VanB family oxidoreductase [Rhodococcus globerulus]